MNRRFFKRMIVVSCIDDRETLRVARENDCECLVVAAKTKARDVFNPVNNKAYFLNRALLTVSPGEWVLLLDADIVLPPNFLELLADQKLDSLGLHGAAMRRLVENIDDLEASYANGPWIERTEFCSGILGFFSLFMRPNILCPLPQSPHPQDPENYHNDHAFAMSFPESRRYVLPIHVLHLGEQRVNWKGRASAPFAGSRVVSCFDGGWYLKGQNGSIEEILEGLPACDVDLVDVLERLRVAEIGRLVGNFVLSLSDSASECLLVLARETELREVAEQVGRIPLSVERVVVVGNALDHRYHPRSTAGILYMFGVPDVRSGEWWLKVLDRAALAQVRCWASMFQPEGNCQPVLVMAFPEGTASISAIFWIDAVRNSWAGRILVYSSEQATDIELYALDQGVEILTGPLSTAKGYTLFDGVREALTGHGFSSAVVLAGCSDNLCKSKVAAVFKEMKGIVIIRCEDVSSGLGETPGDLHLALILLFKRIRRCASREQCPEHVLFTYASETETDLELILSSWIVPDAIIHICGYGRGSVGEFLSEVVGQTVLCHQESTEAVVKDLGEGTQVLVLPNARICRRFALVPSETYPNGRELDRLGWIDPGVSVR